MKLKLLLGLILVFIAGCSQTIEQQESQEEENSQFSYAQCHLEYFVIEPVDELISSNCYAFRNNNNLYDYELDMLNKSLQYAGKEVYAIIHEMEPNTICEHITTENHGRLIYCLEDGSSCLIVEDNKICSIINLT